MSEQQQEPNSNYFSVLSSFLLQPSSKILSGIGLCTCLYYVYSGLKYLSEKISLHRSNNQNATLIQNTNCAIENTPVDQYHHEFYIPKYFSTFNIHQDTPHQVSDHARMNNHHDNFNFKIQFMKENSFALLLTWKDETPSQMFTSHVPFLIEPATSLESVTLQFHLAKTNPHCKALEEFSKSCFEFSPRWKCMVIFAGPHFYISPKWYGDREVQKRQVPTWNFTSIHAMADTCQVIHDMNGKKEIVTQLTNVHEEWLLKTTKNPNESDLVKYDFSQIDEKYSQVLLNEIVGFTLNVKEVKEKWKLSQNKSFPVIQSVVEGLKRQGSDLAVQTSELMNMMKKNE
ncbi:hypothetical protein FDP41_004196 [Naegleria fowleri]|uniref:Uncharacterized protein n=1 Tax=Naegleria fowleri TaxID=5763 RepID=A0A6A5BRI9_NAEFO|nr:uncharacterized protein FDP41_004196 [Naegleria fowleri]KAF0976901.1 hypothetical protein FDP41_004196 [Naegleria fowleri]CAG4717435.1 unnamed protein product [Naegleria fowleri]